METSFKHRGVNIPIRITYGTAMFTLQELGLDILAIFQDSEKVVMTIMANDNVMLKVWHHYVKDVEPDFNSAVEDLEATEMHQFKEAFWQAVVNFSSPPMQPLLEHIWKEVKKSLKQPEKTWKNISSEELPE